MKLFSKIKLGNQFKKIKNIFGLYARGCYWLLSKLDELIPETDKSIKRALNCNICPVACFMLHTCVRLTIQKFLPKPSEHGF